MERRREFEKQSIFRLIREKANLKIKDINEIIIDKLDYEIIKIKKMMDDLEISLKANTIDKVTEILKDLEVLIPTYNNNKKLMQIFYHSKMFLNLVDVIHGLGEECLTKLLIFIEKLMKNNKNLSKYLSKNYNFINTVMKLMLIPEFFEIGIKMCEDLFINSQDLIQISKLTYLHKLYSINAKNKLDSLCRILAILMFDHKKIDFKQIFKYKNYLKIRPFFKTTSENQSFCLNYYNFVPSLFYTLKTRLSQVIEFIKLSNSIREYDSGSSSINQNPSSVSNSETKQMPLYKETNLGPEPKEKIRNFIESLKFKKLLNPILMSPVFDSLEIDWEFIQKTKNKDNIFNTYIKTTKLIKNHTVKQPHNEKYEQYIIYLKYSTFQIEMLFVLSTLLGGKRKAEVQDILSGLNVIDVISNYVDYFDWGNIHCESDRPSFDQIPEANLLDENAYHGNGCKCESDSALKIQFLRFIYTFCCRDSKNIFNKFLLLSEKDKENCFMQGYFAAFQNFFSERTNLAKERKATFNKTHKIIQDLLECSSFTNSEKIIKDQVNSILINEFANENIKSLITYFNSKSSAKPGLLGKLIYNYILECHYSSSKFWLASCIEVVLRGNNSFIQFFVANSGIMPCILYDILYSKTEKIAILQMSFDLLGELIKFNKANFILLNYFFVDTNEFKLFCSKIISKQHLIDSNVFLRSVILSIEKINNQEKDEAKRKNIQIFELFSEKCKICTFVNQNRENIFYELIQLVKPNDINQTNISCINTSLIILVFEKDKGQLLHFIKRVRTTYLDHKEVLENYKNLLLIWKQFYNYRPKDCSSLEHSTTISFKRWYQIIDILLEPSGKSESSLYYTH